MPSTRSKKAKARRSREADKMSDLENLDVMIGSAEYTQIEREIDQITGFANMLDRDDNEGTGSMRGNSSQKTKNRNMSANRNNTDFSRNIETGEMNSQEMNSLINGVNSKIESAINLQYLKKFSQGCRMLLRPS